MRTQCHCTLTPALKLLTLGRSVKLEQHEDKPPAAQVHIKLLILCLNPAVVTQQIGEAAHSVIVTSGTLAPMSSLPAELGIPFGTKLETGHVVPTENVRSWSAGTLPVAVL